jgi:hypothetical protein
MNCLRCDYVEAAYIRQQIRWQILLGVVAFCVVCVAGVSYAHCVDGLTVLCNHNSSCYNISFMAESC